MTEDRTVRRAEGVLWRNVGPEVVATATDREGFEVLSPSAGAAWRKLDRPRVPEDLVASLAEEYGLDPAAIRSDVQELLGDLVDRGLVELDAEI